MSQFDRVMNIPRVPPPADQDGEQRGLTYLSIQPQRSVRPGRVQDRAEQTLVRPRYPVGRPRLIIVLMNGHYLMRTLGLGAIIAWHFEKQK